MTDESDESPAEEPEPENAQSLTDFFDEMDRAAFKRALENRDAHRDELRESVIPTEHKSR